MITKKLIEKMKNGDPIEQVLANSWEDARNHEWPPMNATQWRLIVESAIEKYLKKQNCEIDFAE